MPMYLVYISERFIDEYRNTNLNMVLQMLTIWIMQHKRSLAVLLIGKYLCVYIYMLLIYRHINVLRLFKVQINVHITESKKNL